MLTNNGGKMIDRENVWEDAIQQLELPLWEDEDIEGEDYIEIIKKNGKIKMEEE